MPLLFFLNRPLNACLSLMFCGFFTQTVNASNLLGGDSFADECYQASQLAIASQTSNRIDLGVCTRAIKDANLSPQNLIGTYVNRGVIYMAMGLRDKALKDLNRALKLDVNTGEAYVNRGNLWFSVNKLERAIKDYDLAIKLGVKKTHVAYLNRGIAKESLGYLSSAQRDYKSALLLQEQWPDAVFRLDRVTQAIQQELKKREINKRNKSS